MTQASNSSLKSRLKTKLLVDGGDPEETRRVKDLLGFVDGQTTNPSLIAKNPEVRQLVASGHRLTADQEAEEYKKIVRQISPLVGDAGVSIEVFADFNTAAEDMFRQGKDMFSWIPNAYVKYPCTAEGLKAAEMSVKAGIRVNMTLCFSQAQAAAVYAATRGSKAPVYVSPFIGRLDDHGKNGVDVISNIKRMYTKVMVTLRCWPQASATSSICFTALRREQNWQQYRCTFCSNGWRKGFRYPTKNSNIKLSEKLFRMRSLI